MCVNYKQVGQARCSTCLRKSYLKKSMARVKLARVGLLVFSFVLRSFKFVIAFVVANRFRNERLYVARACTYERITIVMIYGRPCAIESALAIYLFISYFLFCD